MEININKRTQGVEGIPVAECINRHLDKWRVRTDFQPYHEEEEGRVMDGVTFIETEFSYKPSMEEVKEFCHDVINKQTDEEILSGFVWTPEGGEPINVWLSAENQRNFSEAQRMAEKYGSAVLPLTFKLGEDAEGAPVYHTFETVAELDDFYTKAFAYVNVCLNAGWQKKDSFDFTSYELILNPVVETEEESDGEAEGEEPSGNTEGTEAE